MLLNLLFLLGKTLKVAQISWITPKGPAFGAVSLAYDAGRSKYFESQGYWVICFWNNQVEKDIEGVVRAIELALSDV